jgi:DNA-binding GntR family transcriptional regulator
MNPGDQSGRPVEGLAGIEVRPSRRSLVIRDLHAAIISGRMRPGCVYSAPVLAAQFGVSPTPVREAMLDLAKEGLVEIVRNKGFRVLEVSAQELGEIFEIRMMLEVPAVTKIAATGVSATVLDELGELADESVRRAEKRDFAGHMAADTDFHLTLLAQARNRQLVDIVRVLRAKSRVSGVDSPEKAERLVECSREHGRLVILLRARDVCGVQDLMARHILAGRELWGRDGQES